jgi:hypothetical protein
MVEHDRAALKSRGAAGVRAARKRVYGRAFLIWIALVAVLVPLMLGVGSTGSSSGGYIDPVRPLQGTLGVALGLGFGLLLCGAVLFRMRRAVKSVTSARRTGLDLVLDPTSKSLEALAKQAAAPGFVGAYAGYNLCRELESRSRFGDALASCEDAISKLISSELSRAVAQPLVLPALFGERAFLFAVLGGQKGDGLRIESAKRELAALRRDFPTSIATPTADRRITMAIALAEGRMADAQSMARRPDAVRSLGYREELLWDLLALEGDPAASHEERAALHEEIATDPEIVTWIDAVAPALRTRTDAVKVRVGESPIHQAEEEQDAFDDPPDAAQRTTV